jgi:putative oxidoreductase
MKRFFSPEPVAPDQMIATVRIVLGLLLVYHGVEVFDSELMKSYMEWDQFKGPMAAFIVYAGKLSELVAGILITLGLFTRLGALLIVGTFLFITFFVGKGRFWYQDQHPFMFALFGILYLFIGPGGWSLDAILFGGRSQSAETRL